MLYSYWFTNTNYLSSKKLINISYLQFCSWSRTKILLRRGPSLPHKLDNLDVDNANWPPKHPLDDRSLPFHCACLELSTCTTEESSESVWPFPLSNWPSLIVLQYCERQNIITVPVHLLCSAVIEMMDKTFISFPLALSLCYCRNPSKNI